MSNYIDLFTKPKGSSWYYKEMGSRDKKTGKLKYYKVKVTDYKIVDCTCPAREFNRYSPCKHMKRLHEKIGNEL
jgi:hypothetical protein